MPNTSHQPRRTDLPAVLTISISFLFLLFCGACNNKQSTFETVDDAPSKQPVRVLVIDDLPLAEAIQRQWTSRPAGPIETANMTREQLADSTQLEADVVVYPSMLMGELVGRQLIEALPSEIQDHAQYVAKNVFSLQRLKETRWGNASMAVTFGSPQPVIYYRPDVLEQLRLEPPQNWAAYLRVLQVLEQRRDELEDARDNPDWKPHAEPWAPGWAGQMLSARAAVYATHRAHYSTFFDYSNMEPLIAGEPFVRALSELVAAAALAPPECRNWSPEEVKQQFFSRRVAMAISWPRPTGDVTAWSAANAVPLAFLEMPGSGEVYNFDEQTWDQRTGNDDRRIPLLGIAGRMGSVTREVRRRQDAANLLAWISGEEWSGVIATSSSATTMFRDRHLASASAWVEKGIAAEAALGYGRLVEMTQNRNSAMLSLRLPGAARYLAALDAAVQQALSGQQEPAAALQQAADQWRAITEELGADAQRDAYRHSLGLE